MLDNWQRIEKIVNWTGLSVNAFARNIGLKRAENLYQIKKGNHGISKELAELITTRYNTVNKAWLLTGVGEMFLEDVRNAAATSIPYYKVDVVRLLLSQEFFTPSSFLSISFFNGCELAALNMSNTMLPDIPFGAIVLVKKTEVGKILPGNNYVVMSASFNGIRTVRREPRSDELRLVPRNKENYDDIIITVDQVNSIYEIKGHIVPK